MNAIDSLFVSIGLDSSSLQKDFDVASKKITSGLIRLRGQVLAPFKTVLNSVFSGMDLGTLTKQYLSQADALGKQAKALGISVENLNAWQESAKQAGGSANAFQISLRRLTSNIQQVANTGKGSAAVAFKQLGVSLKNSEGKARDVFDVLLDLSSAAEKMSAQEFEGIARAIGIDHGTIMLLQKGRAEVEKMLAEEKELGLITDEDSEVAGRLNDSVEKLRKQFMAFAFEIIREVAPWMTKLLELFRKVFIELRKHEPFLKAFITGISILLTATLIPSLLKTSIAFGAMSLPILAVVAALAALAIAIDDIVVFMRGGKTLLGDFLFDFLGWSPKEIEEFRKKLASIPEWIEEKKKKLLKVLAPFVNWFNNIKANLESLKKSWDDFKNDLSENGLIKALTNLGNEGDSSFKKLIGAAGEFIGSLNPFQPLLEIIIDTVGDAATAIADWARDSVRELIPFYDEIEALYNKVKSFFTLLDSRKPKQGLNADDELGGGKGELEKKLQNLSKIAYNGNMHYSSLVQLAGAFNMSAEQLETIREYERAALGYSYDYGRPKQGNISNNTTNNNDIKIEVTPENFGRVLDSIKQRFSGKVHGNAFIPGVNNLNAGVVQT